MEVIRHADLGPLLPMGVQELQALSRSTASPQQPDCCSHADDNARPVSHDMPLISDDRPANHHDGK